jgi:membrane peptidoglycan carboxypeptidase
MSKDEQLRLFVNTVYLGADAHGFDAGARRYFHKPFAQLTEKEYTSLPLSYFGWYYD